MREMMPALTWLITTFASAAALVSELSGGGGPVGNQNAARNNAKAVVQTMTIRKIRSRRDRRPTILPS